MDASELHARKLNAKEVLKPQRSGNFIFPVARGTEKKLWVRTTSENVHVNPGGVQKEEKYRKFFKESQMNYILQPNFKTTRRGMMRKLKVTSGLSQENSFIVITLNPESNCTCREKNNFLFRWSTSTLPEQHLHLWTSCWRKYWSLLERGWRKRIIWCVDRLQKIHSTRRRTTWWIRMVRGRRQTYEETNNLSSRQCMARCVEAYVWCSKEESKTRMGHWETKARQCQTIERNILYLTKRWKNQAHNDSRS